MYTVMWHTGNKVCRRTYALIEKAEIDFLKHHGAEIWRGDHCILAYLL